MSISLNQLTNQQVEKIFLKNFLCYLSAHALSISLSRYLLLSLISYNLDIRMKFLWLIVVTVCGIGFMIQVSHGSNRYFLYHTRTVFDFEIPIVLPRYPAITYWVIVGLLDRKIVRMKYPLLDIENYNKVDMAFFTIQTYHQNSLYLMEACYY